jgi:outer membrane lipoprotein SlyB
MNENRPVSLGDGIARAQRKRRVGRFRKAAAQELLDERAGAAWGALAGLAVGATVAASAGLGFAVVLPLAIVLGAIAGYVGGPKLAMWVLRGYVGDADDE